MGPWNNCFTLEGRSLRIAQWRRLAVSLPCVTLFCTHFRNWIIDFQPLALKIARASACFTANVVKSQYYSTGHITWFMGMSYVGFILFSGHLRFVLPQTAPLLCWVSLIWLALMKIEDMLREVCTPSGSSVRKQKLEQNHTPFPGSSTASLAKRFRVHSFAISTQLKKD